MSKLPNEDMSAATAPQNVEIENDPIALTAGARLLEARQARQLNLRDVAEKTRQSKETLQALENMETAHMPPSLVRLQARNYARFLGLPEDEIASGFQSVQDDVQMQSSPIRATAPAIPLQAIVYGVGAVIIGAAIVSAAILVAQPKPAETNDPLAISARLAPAYADMAELDNLASEVGEEFGIIATQRAWVEVRASDGTVFRNREMEIGETYFPRMGAGWTITVRDAGAFRWQLGDTAGASLGESGQALYSVSVDDALASTIDARSSALAQAPGRDGQQR